MEISKVYSPQQSEDKWYKYWLENGIFDSDVDKSKTPYTIVIPPPNITGILHIGHVLNNTIQDIMIRYKRMQGFNACWVPGTDHASIATESKVVKHLRDQGISKHDISRKDFLVHCHEWKEKYGGIIIEQLKKLGVSCDWRRLRFTMDDDYYQKVIEAFVKLYNDGKIYRGYRLVNWDPANKSAISDEEVIFQNVKGKLWYIRYQVKGTDEYITVATTRPETMLGDVAVAVNPNDERYKHHLGKTLILPLVGREIPLLADEVFVDPAFGTGAVKITPAHDFNDYEFGQRHNLPLINIFHPDASTNDNVPEKYRSLDRYECRKAVIKDLIDGEFLVKEEDYTNNVGYSERGHVPIEPYLSEQWYLKMEEIAAPALKAVNDGTIRFHPNHWVKTYDHWMNNIKDWCISRQLWWGHRIPVWYHNETNEIYCGVNPPEDPENWHQDEDVLDTWASSWLWAHDVFKTEDEKRYYYPTNTLVTAPEIIFFWVARMIMAGYYFEGQIPFRDVYFTSIIRDQKGRKMSKSLGNSPDPLEIIADYGADALRFTIIYQAPLGQDVLFSMDSLEIGRNFANKLWNAGRFLLMNYDGDVSNAELLEDDFVDRWMESAINSALKDFGRALDNFEINNSSKIVYSFVWNDFCDWYIELIKNKLYSQDEKIKKSAIVKAIRNFEKLLQLVHPLMPFITEELWHQIRSRKAGESICASDFPAVDESKIDKQAENDMLMLQALITAVRNIRGEMQIHPSQLIDIHLKSGSFNPEYGDYIKRLAKVGNIVAGADIAKPKMSASAVVKDAEVFIPLEGIIDIEVEKKRVEKEILRLQGALEGIEKKLSNPSFVDRAPADVVEKERQKKADWSDQLGKLKQIYSDLG